MANDEWNVVCQWLLEIQLMQQMEQTIVFQSTPVQVGLEGENLNRKCLREKETYFKSTISCHCYTCVYLVTNSQCCPHC